jgi:hypothetical protein
VNRVVAFAWYRFKTTMRQRWTGWVSIVVLIALLGGLSMAAIAGARRTQSSFTTFLASTNPSQLRLGTDVYDPSIGFNTGYDEARARQIAHLPHVRKVESAVLFNLVPYLVDNEPSPNGEPHADDPVGLNALGSVDGLYFDDDRVTVTKGRMANPHNPNEVIVQSSQGSGLHVGEQIAFGVYSNAQVSKSGFTPASAPYRRVVVTVAGFAASNDAVVADSVDDSGSFLLLFTPAFTKEFLKCCARATPDTGVQVAGGASNVAKVESEIEGIWPKDAGSPSFYVSSVTEAKAERAVKPESIALGLFGLIAALAALLIVGQTIARELRRAAVDKPAIRALGAGMFMSLSDGLIGLGASIALGSVLAVGVAYGLSPIAPIGLVRPVYPGAGFAFDWTVLGFGFLALLVCLMAVAVFISYRLTFRRGAGRFRSETSGVASQVQKVVSGLPAPAVVGIGFALNRRVGQNAVPVRSATLGVALAILVGTVTLTFGASLHTLVSRPALYGWNWNYELIASGGSSDIPGGQASKLLNADHDVTAWSGVYFATLNIDGQLVPVLGGTPGASVAPPILAGHSLNASNQVVLGTQTLAQLHKHIGDTVEVRSANGPSTRLKIVGTAVMPAIGTNYIQHLEMGTGALLSYTLIPAFSRNPLGASITGPNAILVRLRAGATTHSIQEIANVASGKVPSAVNLQGVERPAEIRDYRSMSTAPALLSVALAIGAVFAFGLALISSVQRRRRELALLKTIGFTRRQLVAVVAWQASVDVAVGAVVGLVIGVLAGRWLWNIFARNIGVVPRPTIPVVPIVLMIVGAFVLANIVAFIPGFIAARTKPASLFRAD